MHLIQSETKDKKNSNPKLIYLKILINPSFLLMVCVGKNSFLWEGPTPKVIITDPEQIKEIFNKIQDFEKPKLSPSFKLLGTGLANLEGDIWRMHRKIINPAFHVEKLKVIYMFCYQHVLLRK